MKTKVRIDIQKNEVSDLSSYVPFADIKKSLFYSIGSKTTALATQETSKVVLDIRLQLDNKYQMIDRNVYTFGDLLGLVGGVYQILTICGLVVKGVLSSRIYAASLLSKLYQISEVNQAASQTVKVFTKSQLFKSELSLKPQSKEGTKSDHTKQVLSSEESRCSETTDRIIESIRKRRWYQFDWKVIIYSALCFLNFKCKNKCRMYDHRRVFTAGCSKFDHELDLVLL